MKNFLLSVLSCLLSLQVTARPAAYSAEMIQSHGKEWSADMMWDYVSGLVTKSILMYCAQYPDDELSAQACGWSKEYAG